MATQTERKLERELKAARELCEVQLLKIRRLQQQVDHLTRKLERSRATVAELLNVPGRGEE